jgi:hypothetical protein
LFTAEAAETPAVNPFGVATGEFTALLAETPETIARLLLKKPTRVISPTDEAGELIFWSMLYDFNRLLGCCAHMLNMIYPLAISIKAFVSPVAVESG